MAGADINFPSTKMIKDEKASKYFGFENKKWKEIPESGRDFIA